MANIAIFRINYKSDFILTLNSDAGWMTPFCIKFWTGAPSQAYFVGFDGTTYTHCVPVAGEPTKLLVQFDDHHLPIGDLKFQIAYHFTVADFPNDTEDEVINPSNITTEIDGETYQVMLDFTGETAPEIEFSLPAYANEAQRIANEQQRIANEQTRIENEQTRISNEQTRVAHEQTRQQNEAQRIAQESARVSEFASLKSASESATRDANNAATLANEKAQLADDKAALADGAATQASLNAVYAHDEGQLAGQKAIEAAQATQLATNEAAFAHDQGTYAKNQGDYAKAQGDTALADHVRANADHSTAVDDHTKSSNDHTRAESDHSTSAADHTTAGNDHTLAESDHGIAADDHTQAGNDHTRAESDHGIASDDHTQAGNDHTRAESDHTRAESDHAAVEVYVDSLGAFDISAYHATGGVLAEYADLTAALGTNGANIPDALRKGGMSIKFIQGTVQNSDNKYVQYRYMSTSTAVADFTNKANWQGVDDEPTAGSDNLVKSGGVENENINNLSSIYVGTFNGVVNSSGLYDLRDGAESRVVKVSGYSEIKIKKNATQTAILSLLTSISNISNGNAASFCNNESRRVISDSSEHTISIPSDCKYIVFNTKYSNIDFTPSVLSIDGIDVIDGISNIKIYLESKINAEKARAIGVETSIQEDVLEVNGQIVDITSILNGQKDIAQISSSDIISGKYIGSDGIWRELSTARCTITDISDYQNLHISDLISSSVSQYAFFKSYNDTSVVFADGTGRVSGDLDNTLIPSDANYLYLYYNATTPVLPKLHIKEATLGILECVGANMYAAKTTDELNIYKKVAQSPYYVCYTYKHRLKAFTQNEYPSYYDNWGLTNAAVVTIVDGVITSVLTMLYSAEAELAVSVTNPNGGYQYVGGSMHGFDNILTDNEGDRNLSIIIDNINIAEDAVFELKPVNRVIIQYTGNLYQAYTNSNPFSLVKKVMDYSDDGIFISNKMTLLRNMDFNAAQFGMMKLRRHYLGDPTKPYIVNKAIRNSEPYHIYTVDDAWKESGVYTGIGSLNHDATKITEYGAMGMGFSLEVIESTLKPNGGMKVWHNGSADAKIYFDLIGGVYSATQGEVLSAKVKWEVFGSPIL